MDRQIQQGQALMVGLVALVCVVLAGAAFVQVGQTTLAKIRLTNAVDAAAYSAGVWSARQLNFIAYTNRAMIANYMAAGHAVAYVSWLRYTNQQVQNIDAVLRYVPYVREVSNIVATIVENNKEISEDYTVPGYLAVVDGINRLIYASQIAAKGDAILRTLPDLAEEVIKSYDESFRVNDPEFIRAIPSIYKVTAVKALMSQYSALLNFTSTYQPDGTFKPEHRHVKIGEEQCFDFRQGGCDVPASTIYALTKHSVEQSPSRQWLHKRRHTHSFTALVKLKKRSETEIPEALDDWQQSDQMKLDVLFDTDIRIGSGEATATDLYGLYSGIAGYHDLAEDTIQNLVRQDEQASLAMEFIAADLDTSVVSFPFITPKEQINLFARAKVEVYYKRPGALPEIFSLPQPFQPVTDELPNLFNPFWRAKLVGVDWL